MSNKPYDRTSLKSLFADGNRPNAQNFGSLIDSMVNKVDDGISKTMKDGLILAPEGTESDRVLCFKDKIQDDLPKWSFELKQEANQGLALVQPISSNVSETRLFFTKKGAIGVGTETPKTNFEVQGVSGFESRMGTYQMGSIPADRQWHDITPELNGCKAFEIIAQVGKQGQGRYALLHAHALSTFGKSWQKIRKTQARYDWRWWNRISLRFAGSTYKYRLQMRTRSNFGDGVNVKYHISKLWDDDIMNTISAQE
ncbi:MAG: adhesin [Flavobacteriaceae bacterium]|nr:adhesin [Flavobacteriaceae bacterium]|tara:strand:- start:38698 stop:39462 length:765 start_codon:yes stop_codon:yes gene_type:complete